MSHSPSHSDTGYTTGFYDGKQAEQERISKLLEAEYAETIDLYGIALVKRELDLLLKLMALIKRENK